METLDPKPVTSPVAGYLYQYGCRHTQKRADDPARQWDASDRMSYYHPFVSTGDIVATVVPE